LIVEFTAQNGLVDGELREPGTYDECRENNLVLVEHANTADYRVAEEFDQRSNNIENAEAE